MSNITHRLVTKSADAFINAAPAKTIRKVGNQVAISLAMPPELLDQIDQAVVASNISRAAFIKHALSRAVVENN
jgi:hypothetical protein